MTIQLDWFGCEPHAQKEKKIHHTLEVLHSMKSVTRASVRVEEHPESSPPFHLSIMLSMPGPDVVAHGTGQTFDEALLKLEAAAKKALDTRASKARQVNIAARGVKAAHRG